jgi:hypothetical protein
LIQRRRDAALAAAPKKNVTGESSGRSSDRRNPRTVEPEPLESEGAFVDYDELEIYEEY